MTAPDRLAALERENERLRAENQHLSAEADNALHLHIFAEKLTLEETLEDIIAISVESIATFKSMPYCAYLIRDGEELEVVDDFSLGGYPTNKGRRFPMTDEMIRRLESLEAYVDLRQPAPCVAGIFPSALQAEVCDGYQLPVFLNDRMHGVLLAANTDESANAQKNHAHILGGMVDQMQMRLAHVSLLQGLEATVRERTQALRESEQRLSLHMENTPLGMISWDKDFNCTQWNPAAEKIFGFTLGEALGNNALKLLVPEDNHDHIDGVFEALMNQKGGDHSINENITKDGRTVLCEWFNTPLKGEDGTPIGVASLVQDITDRKQAEKALAESRDRFLTMLEESPIGVGVSQVKDGHIEYVNMRLAEMFGSSVEELMGLTGPDFWFDPADRDEFIRSFNANGRVSGTSIKLKKKDGSPFWSMLTWEKAETFGEGCILFWVYDISDLKNTQLELLAAKQTADNANKAKSEFLSSMSHELRTPLNGILGFAQLLEFDPNTPLTDKQKDCTDQIMKSGHHLLELIDQVLELAQIEAGKVTINIEDVSLSELLNECVPLVAAMADKRGVTLDIHGIHCEGVVVRADRVRLKQIVLNLLSNAVKYNRDEGFVSINVYVGNMGMMRVAVTDTGPGIPEDKQDSLFQPFERLGYESSEIEGTGIGLTITRDLVHLMEGEIGFASEVGRGSTFWIEVPQAFEVHDRQVTDDTDATDDVDLGKPIGNAAKRYTVLYVEDNPANLELMKHIFAGAPNLDLISTHTAELGIEMAEARHPDLVLMDINLPGMNGIEALARLRKGEKTGAIPVIAISAAAMPHEVKKGKEAGFDAYLTKPLQFDKLFNAMHKALKAG